MVHTLKYTYSAIYGLLKLHGFMLDARFPKGEGVSAVPAYLVFCLASHHSWIFGGMSFLPAVPCTYLMLQFVFPWMHPCATIQIFASVVVTWLMYVCKIIIHCLATPSQ